VCVYRNNDDTDDDDDQHGDALVAASHLVHQGDRHLPGRVLRVRLLGAARVRRRQLHVLGRAQRTQVAPRPTTDTTDAPRRHGIYVSS